MKKPLQCFAFLFLTFSLSLSSLFAQAPQKMSYQAVIRDATNRLITNSPVGVRISILQGTSTGTAQYVETQTVSTNANGLLTLRIGEGTVVSGSLATVNWAVGPYFIHTETDPTGGTNYTISSTTQFLSVPYALYAEKSGTAGPAGPTGPKGDKGDKGDDGDIGATGATGAAGANGATGAMGAAGPTGATGTNGVDGATGAKGDKGDKGDDGAIGATGVAGPTGSTGATGDKGDKGDKGDDGAMGATGATGTNGTNGATGATGVAGP
jgi:hypothetical protein